MVVSARGLVSLCWDIEGFCKWVPPIGVVFRNWLSGFGG